MKLLSDHRLTCKAQYAFIANAFNPKGESAWGYRFNRDRGHYDSLDISKGNLKLLRDKYTAALGRIGTKGVQTDKQKAWHELIREELRVEIKKIDEKLGN